MGYLKHLLLEIEETEDRILDLKKQARKIARKLKPVKQQLFNCKARLETLKSLTKPKQS